MGEPSTGGRLHPSELHLYLSLVRAHVAFPRVHFGKLGGVKASPGARFHSPVIRVGVARWDWARFAFLPGMESRWTQYRHASLAVAEFATFVQKTANMNMTDLGGDAA